MTHASAINNAQIRLDMDDSPPQTGTGPPTSCAVQRTMTGANIIHAAFKWTACQPRSSAALQARTRDASRRLCRGRGPW
jgi:hypothetical protein